MSKNSNEYICPTCNHEFYNHQALTRHINGIRKCHGPIECIRCKNIFARYRDLENHLARKNPCKEVSLPIYQPEIKMRELDIEEKKLILIKEIEEMKLANTLELRREEMANALAIEKEKTARKKISSQATIINNYIINYNDIPKEAIDNLTYEESIKILESDNMLGSIVVHLYNNPNYEKHQSIKCVDKAYEKFMGFFNGKWIPLEYDSFYPSIRNNSQNAAEKIKKNTMWDTNCSNDVRKTNSIKYEQIVNKHNVDINNPNKHVKKIIIDSLPNQGK